MENKEIDIEEATQEELDLFHSLVKKVPDHPQKGVLFYDLFSILNSVEQTQKLFDYSIRKIKKFIATSKVEINTIVGLESRGFLLGLVLADRLKLPFVPIRKKNKLPGGVYKVNYVTEYSKDQFEIQVDALNENSKVLIVDDLLATGGSIRAAEDLIAMAKAETIAYFLVFEIVALEGKKKLSKPDNLLTLIPIKPQVLSDK